MKLEKAIEILTDQAGKGYHFPDQQRKEASRLGAEALKRLHNARVEGTWASTNTLQGETED